MRPILWLLSIGGALGAAYGLYHLEHEVKTMERVLARMEDGTRRDNEAVQVLQAEWSYLNRPDRLQELAARHLNLTPSSLKQIATAPAAVAALPVAVSRPPSELASDLLPVMAELPIPVPKPAPPRRAVAPVVPVLQPAPAPRPQPAVKSVQTVAAVAVPATFRIEDIQIGGGR